MVHWAKDKQFFLFIVPITAQSPKNRRTIIERVCGDPDLRLRIGDNLALKICMFLVNPQQHLQNQI